MRFIVSGLPRSGTSVMMRALRAGAIPLFYDPDLERRFRLAFPAANREGFFELRGEHMIRQGIPDGHAAKVFPKFIDWLPLNVSYKVLVMHRDDAAREASYRRVFAGIPDAAFSNRQQEFRRNLEAGLAYMDAQADFSLRHVRLEELVADTEIVLRQVSAFLDCPQFDIAGAATVFHGDRAASRGPHGERSGEPGER